MKIAALGKLVSSSTFWCSVLLPALNLVSTTLGYPIPWDVILAGIGAYGVKEAAKGLKTPVSQS